MTDVANVLLERAEPKRDRFGRYLIGGKPYTRATTWAGTVDERYNLERWQQRQVAFGLSQRQDLIARVAACRPDDKDELGKLCDAAIEAAKGSAGANLGTALHAFTERIDLGEDLVVPAPWDADVAAYRATLDAAGIVIDPVNVERIVVNHTLGVAGTFDRLAEVPDLPGGCDLAVVDLKTGGFLSWQSIAVQLALYARAEELYDPVSDTCSPMPFVNREWGVVVHLPAGTASCTLHLVDLVAGWAMAQTCGVVREWRKRKDLAKPYVVAVPEPVAPTPPTEADVKMRDWLYRRIAALRDAGRLDELAAAWPDGVPTFKNATHHTAAQLRQIESAVSTVELEHGVATVAMEPLADSDDADAMVERLKALDADTLAAVSDAAKAASLPHVRRMTAEQLGELGVILARIEADRVRGAA